MKRVIQMEKKIARKRNLRRENVRGQPSFTSGEWRRAAAVLQLKLGTILLALKKAQLMIGSTSSGLSEGEQFPWSY